MTTTRVTLSALRANDLAQVACDGSKRSTVRCKFLLLRFRLMKQEVDQREIIMEVLYECHKQVTPVRTGARPICNRYVRMNLAAWGAATI
jgi:hypothetical protein